jgi:hypothetical protein
MSSLWGDYFNQFVVDNCDTIDPFFWYDLSSSENITINFVRKYKDYIDLDAVVSNKNYVTFNDIISNMDLEWDLELVPLKASWKIYQENPNPTDNFVWHTKNFNHFEDLTCDIITNNPHIEWDYMILSYHQCLTQEFIRNNIDKQWDFDALSSHKVITLDFILSLPDVNWSYKSLSLNNNIPIDYILTNNKYTLLDRRFLKYSNTISYENPLENLIKYPNVKWDYYYLGSSVTLDIDELFKLKLDLNENDMTDLYNGLSENPKLDFYKHVVPNIKMKWNSSLLSLNKCINMAIVNKFSMLKWDYKLLSLNTNITPEDVENNPSIPWDYNNLSANKSITWEYIKRNLHIEWDIAYVINKDLLFSEILEYKEFFGEKFDILDEDCFIREKNQFMESQVI